MEVFCPGEDDIVDMLVMEAEEAVGFLGAGVMPAEVIEELCTSNRWEGYEDDVDGILEAYGKPRPEPIPPIPARTHAEMVVCVWKECFPPR
jgi:hypothetical protein